jgi:hypothetical protein
MALALYFIYDIVIVSVIIYILPHYQEQARGLFHEE